MSGTPEMDAELAVLNSAVEEALSARKAWMDAHMTAYAKYQIGDVLYDMETGHELGPVVEHYRYHAGHPQFDDKMEIYYRYRKPNGVIDNTSRQFGLRIGTRAALAADLRSRAKYLEMCDDPERWSKLFRPTT